MASTTCGWCNHLTHMKAVTKLSIPGGHLANSYVQGVYKCVNCEQISVATLYDSSYQHSLRTGGTDDADKYVWGWGTRWLPEPDGPREYPDVPEHIASAATEATLCLSGGTYRAVGGLARAVIEAIGKQQGHTMRGILTKINAMADAGVLRPLVAEQAREVQQFGNEMAHGDFATPTTREEAEEIIVLMDEVLREVYQAPAQLARVKVAREGRKSNGRTKDNSQIPAAPAPSSVA